MNRLLPRILLLALLLALMLLGWWGWQHVGLRALQLGSSVC
ncbi:hypothetical protein M2401_006108 [Pseudomonas sp. JUb42]|nr:hypothetical protein [Pseudomonas sp. JUb42]MCS3472344.1 hypothetical protein [Pseudomonas sp. JUb42]